MLQLSCSVDHKAMTKVLVCVAEAAQMGEGKRHVADIVAGSKAGVLA